MTMMDKVLIKLKNRGIRGVTAKDFHVGTRLASYVHRLRSKGYMIEGVKCVDSPLYKYTLVEQP